MRVVVELALGDAALADGVDGREVGLRVARLEVAEQVEDLGEHLVRGARRWRSILLMTTMTGKPRSRHLRSTKRVCGSGPFGGVDEEQRAVGHHQRALDLAAEVGVAGGVDDVDLDALRSGRLVFFARMVIPRSRSRSFESMTRSATASFSRNVPALAEHGVDEGGLAVVDVGDDGDVT